MRWRVQHTGRLARTERATCRSKVFPIVHAFVADLLQDICHRGQPVVSFVLEPRCSQNETGDIRDLNVLLVYLDSFQTIRDRAVVFVYD